MSTTICQRSRTSHSVQVHSTPQVSDSLVHVGLLKLHVGTSCDLQRINVVGLQLQHLANAVKGILETALLQQRLRNAVQSQCKRRVLGWKQRARQ